MRKVIFVIYTAAISAVVVWRPALEVHVLSIKSSPADSVLRVLQVQEASCNRMLFIDSRTRTMLFGSQTFMPDQDRTAPKRWLQQYSKIASSKPMVSPVCAGAEGMCQH